MLMNRIYHGDELRAENVSYPVPDYLPVKESGSVFYSRYESLLRDDNQSDARQLGVRALEHVWWSNSYPVSDIELKDQSDIAALDNETITELLIRQKEIVSGISQQFEVMLPNLYDRLALQLDSATENGYITKEVKERFDSVREQTVWLVTDGMGDTLGTASPIDKTALISSHIFRTDMTASSEVRVAEVFTHEMMHRLTGVSAVGDDDRAVLYRAGLESPNSRTEDVWLNEAVTERIAWHLMHNDWHVKQQWVTSRNYTYDQESAQLRLLVEAIPFQVFVDYYFDESDDGQSKKELHKAFRETFGVTYHTFLKKSADRDTRTAYLKELMAAISNK